MKQCSVNGCNKKFLAKGLCSKHWSQLKRRGAISKYNRLSPNKLVIHDNFAEVILSDNLGNEKSRSVIDLEKIETVKQYKWYQNNSGYAISRVNKNKQIFLHRIIVGNPIGYEVDHIDGDPLNNRKSNLRICSHQENIMNQKIRIDNTSGFKGVNWDKRKGKWRARIHIHGKDKHLGYFESKEEAAKSRVKAEQEYFGEFSRKNVKEMELV